MPKKQPIAFVAMRFSGDHWNDKNYLAIRDVVEEAGFKYIRDVHLTQSSERTGIENKWFALTSRVVDAKVDLR